MLQSLQAQKYLGGKDAVGGEGVDARGLLAGSGENMGYAQVEVTVAASNRTKAWAAGCAGYWLCWRYAGHWLCGDGWCSWGWGIAKACLVGVEACRFLIPSFLPRSAQAPGFIIAFIMGRRRFDKQTNDKWADALTAELEGRHNNACQDLGFDW